MWGDGVMWKAVYNYKSTLVCGKLSPILEVAHEYQVFSYIYVLCSHLQSQPYLHLSIPAQKA